MTDTTGDDPRAPGRLDVAPTPARPLTGTSVVVTRTRAQVSELRGRLGRLGAAVVELPVIAIGDPADRGAALRDSCRRLADGRFDWVVCTSANAVARLLAAVGDAPVPSSVRWAAVGVGTARSLADAGFQPDLVPTVSGSDALAAEFPWAVPPDGRVGAPGVGPAGTILFPRAEVVGGTMAAGLRAKGWSVEEVVAYRTVAGAPGHEAVEEAARCGVIAFTSSSTVTRAIELLGRDGIPPLVVSIGPMTSGTARRAGLVVAKEAHPHTITGLVEAVEEAVVEQGGVSSRPDHPGRGPLARRTGQ